MITLVTRDNKGKIRVVEAFYNWNDFANGYEIHRTTFQYGGKETIQPMIFISEGKAKRTVDQQVELEFNSKIKSYKDKGYKELPLGIEISDKNAVEAFLGTESKTDDNGFKKHMLAKQSEKVATSVYDKVKYWYGSRKLDGIRCSFYLKDGKVKTASRGGKDYDESTKHISTHPLFIKLFEEHPDLILDGELYEHGRSLQQISGAARQEKNGAKSSWLQYYIYDIMLDVPFEERLEIMQDLEEEMELQKFDPNRSYKENELQVQFLPHEKVTGWNNIQKLHDKYVAEGFEGLVIRDPSKVYKYGGRSNDMIKIKNYQDDEFEIIGYSEGLRPEDMVFVCTTKDGREFEAKPYGPRELKYEYLDRMDEIIGKMATVKYFNYSDEGKPTQTNLKCIRDYE